MKHIRFEENILVDESYSGGKSAGDGKKSSGIATHFADSLERYQERRKWYNQLPPEPAEAAEPPTDDKLEQLRREANSALHANTLAYDNKANKNKSSELQWARTLLKQGAIADRVAAATVLIQESPLHNMSALQTLISSVKPAKKKDGIVAIDVLSELFVTELLPPDTKLRKFEQRPLARIDDIASGDRQSRRNILALWYYEHQLKDLYSEYVEALNTFAHDSVEANRDKSIGAMSCLLMHHPENEKILLQNLVNKLGDPAHSVASKVIYHLCQLLYNHPNMKGVVLAEIERMLFRTNIAPRAQYYGVVFLNQFHLGKDDAPVAESLIRIYFSFFKASIKKGEIDSRLMSAILTGVKRAYPFADKSRVGAAGTEHVDAIQRIVHLGSFNIAVHALALLYQISDATVALADRYYCALYRKLGSPELFKSSNIAVLFNLLYKSLRRDDNTHRVMAFVRRCLRLATHMPPHQAIGMLLLISQVTKESKKSKALILTLPKQEIKEEEEKPPQQKQELSALDPVSKHEQRSTVKEAEEKLSKAMMGGADLFKGDKRDLLEDDSEEEYADVKEESGTELEHVGNTGGNVRPRARVACGWHHARLLSPPPADTKKEIDIQLRRTANMDRVVTAYDPYARNPAHAGAQHSACLELVTLAAHFHPTVALFANKLLSGQLVQYSGDPLKDFSGARFLERFCFKNPKRRVDEQPQQEDGVRKVKGSHPKFAIRKNYAPKGVRSVAVTSAVYLNEDKSRIPLDEHFLYDYLRGRREATRGGEEEGEGEESDAESVASEDFDAYLDRLTGTRPGSEESEEEGGELDFMSEVRGARVSAAGDKKLDPPESDDESDADADMDADVGSADEDELALEDSDDEEHGEVVATRGKRGRKKGSESLFASAEEFAELLEETGGEGGHGLSSSADTRDGAAVKQLAWERSRDDTYRGKPRAGKKRPRPAIAAHNKRWKR